MFSHDYGPPALQRDFEAWRETFRSVSARYSPPRARHGNFVGWARSFSGFGFQVVEVGSNLIGRTERTQRDTRVDGIDDFCVLSRIDSSSTVTHNAHTAHLAARDVILHDMARPFVSHTEKHGQWFALRLPRQALVSHLGFEPVGGQRAQGGPRAGRVLRALALSALHGEDVSSSPADAYLQLAIYDFVGALFAQEAWPLLRSSDKLFDRLRRIIDNNFTNPHFGPRDLASEAGISLRYLHKLFGERGKTCGNFIYARRLDHAVQLLRRRSCLSTWQPLSEIAYASGFHDYTHFTRKFRPRFGCTPGKFASTAVDV